MFYFNTFSTFYEKAINAYDALKVDTCETLSKVKASYKKLALLNHPDRNPNDAKKEEEFKKISDAYEFITTNHDRIQEFKYAILAAKKAKEEAIRKEQEEKLRNEQEKPRTSVKTNSSWSYYSSCQANTPPPCVYATHIFFSQVNRSNGKEEALRQQQERLHREHEEKLRREQEEKLRKEKEEKLRREQEEKLHREQEENLRKEQERIGKELRELQEKVLQKVPVLAKRTREETPLENTNRRKPYFYEEPLYNTEEAIPQQTVNRKEENLHKEQQESRLKAQEAEPQRMQEEEKRNLERMRLMNHVTPSQIQYNELNNFSPDVFKEIFTYLDPQDIENLKLVCKNLYAQMNETQMDVAWQPLLNRLKGIDPTLKITNSSGQANSWRSPLFKRLFNLVLSNLRKEVSLLLNNNLTPSSSILQKIKSFDFNNRNAIKLSELEKINELLKEFKRSNSCSYSYYSRLQTNTSPTCVHTVTIFPTQTNSSNGEEALRQQQERLRKEQEEKLHKEREEKLRKEQEENRLKAQEAEPHSKQEEEKRNLERMRLMYRVSAWLNAEAGQQTLKSKNQNQLRKEMISFAVEIVDEALLDKMFICSFEEVVAASRQRDTYRERMAQKAEKILETRRQKRQTNNNESIVRQVQISTEPKPQVVQEEKRNLERMRLMNRVSAWLNAEAGQQTLKSKNQLRKEMISFAVEIVDEALLDKMFTCSFEEVAAASRQRDAYRERMAQEAEKILKVRGQKRKANAEKDQELSPREPKRVRVETNEREVVKGNTRKRPRGM